MMFLLLLTWLFAAGCAIATKTSRFTLELTWETGAPDGYEREMIFINGKYPGPTLEIDQDDWVEIVVINNMPFNSTIHAHGLSSHGFWDMIAYKS
jgi:FtsP/CotA-like multicopper oxidase with cupredoxin domain